MPEQISVNKLLEHVGNLYVKVAQGNEKIDEYEKAYAIKTKENEDISVRFGNALAHLEKYDKEVVKRIMAGENVPVFTVPDKEE